MDPLSVSASVVSLIGAADTVVRRLYKYIKAARGADKHISALSMEITNLYGVLNSLHLVATRFESEVSELNTHERSMQIEHIHACYNTLDSIRTLLKDNDPTTANSKMESIRRRLHWPLSDSKTKELVDEVGRHKQTLALALNADTMAALLQGLSHQKDIANGIDDLKIRMIASSMTEERRKVFKSLSLQQHAEPQKYLASILKLRQMGTGLWISENEQFKAWINSNNARLYLTGIPGAGKTYLFATIVEEVFKRIREKKTGLAFAYYFCDYKHSLTHDPRNIPASLVAQLAAQDEECFNILQTLYHEHNQNEGSSSPYTIEDLKQCLIEMTKTLDHAYIAIDALDECTNDRATVLELLHDLNDFPNDNIKTLYTGREELDIERALHDYDKLSIAADSHDLRLYVDSEIARRTKNGSLRIRDVALKEEIRERLIKKAEGMFRWVACQLDHICSLSNDRSRRKALDSLPPDLPTTYERVLERANTSNRENRRIVERALRWILWAVEPLSLDKLSEAISVSIGDTTLERDEVVDPEAILQWCGSLVRKTPGSDTLELAHYSVKEFLEQISESGSPQYLAYRADAVQDNLKLAKVCLTYLCFDDFDVDQPEDTREMRLFFDDYIFLRYCIHFWDNHARFKEEDDSLMEMLQKFLGPNRSNQYLAWISWIASIEAEPFVKDGEPPEFEVDYEHSNALFSRMADSSPLHWAVKLALPSLCRWLISSHCDVNRKSAFFGPPLLSALCDNDPLSNHGGQGHLNLPSVLEINKRCMVQTVKALIDAGADCNIRVDSSNSHSRPILLEALAAGSDFNIIQLLLDAGSLCDKDCIDLLACQTGEGLNLFKTLTEKNVHDNAKAHFRSLAVTADVGWDQVLSLNDKKQPRDKLSSIEIRPLFFNAAKFGRVQVMERLVKMIREGDEDLSINMLDNLKGTALHTASFYDRPEIIDILVREGIDIDHADKDGKTALMVATERLHYDCAAMLLRHGCDIRVKDKKQGVTALHGAAAHEDTRMLEALLSSPIPEGPSLYARTQNGNTLLHGAAMLGSVSVIQYILEHFSEASIHEQTNDGMGCLALACVSGSSEAVTFFLDRGLPINVWTEKHMSPLLHAIESFDNATELTKLLHSRGADLTKSEFKGDIPLFYQIRRFKVAGTQDMLNCFTYLLDHTADINYCDEDGFNALHWLALSQPEFYPTIFTERACAMLLERGCSLTRCNNNGDTPFQLFLTLWSELPYDTLGFFGYRYKIPEDDQREPQFIPQYDGIRSQVGLTLLIIESSNADPAKLGPPENVNCKGSSMLSLAIRTADQALVKKVMKYDSDVDRRDMVPGFPNQPLNTPLEWMCTGFDPDTELIRTILNSSKALEGRKIDGLAPIHVAASYSNINVLAEILKMGVDIDCLCSNSMSPMMYACDHRELSMIRFLYEQGSKAVVSDKWDSLEVACQAGDKAVLATLYDMPDLQLDWSRKFEYPMDIGPRLNGAGNTRIPASYFHLAAYKGHEQVMSWLMSKDIVQDVNVTVGEGNLTALYLVAGDQDSYKDTLPFLLSKGANLDMTCLELKWTALHAAAEVGNDEVVRILLSAGANKNFKDVRQFTPQLVALENNHIKTAQLLKNRTDDLMKENHRTNALPNNEDSLTNETIKYGDRLQQLGPPMHSCAKSGALSMVRKLLDDGADVNARLADCSTPAMKAARGGHCEVLDLLKERGADLSAKTVNAGTALHFACTKRQTVVIPGLLACGLKFTDADVDDTTPLHCAVAVGGFHRIFHSFIMQHCGTVVKELSPIQLRTLGERACAGSHAPILKWMLDQLDVVQKCALVQGTKGFGSLLHLAAAQANIDALDVLLNADADINQVTETRESPIACAASMGRVEAVQHLARKGASLTYNMPDGTHRSVIDAAKDYPKIQQWLRQYYDGKSSAADSAYIPHLLDPITEGNTEGETAEEETHVQAPDEDAPSKPNGITLPTP